MIVRLVLKYAKYLLDIAIVLGVILLIFIVNPFKMFGDGVKLQDTANIVTSIKAIGQLVTAEYYGEVISSTEKAQQDYLETAFTPEVEEAIYQTVIGIIDSNFRKEVVAEFGKKQVRRNKSKVKSAFKTAMSSSFNEISSLSEGENAYPDTILNMALLHMAESLYDIELDKKNYKRIRKGKVKGDKALEDNVKDLIKNIGTEIKTKWLESDSAYEAFLKQEFRYSNSFPDYASSYIEAIETRRERRVDIAVIGRGWVKAGFDFGTLTERDFYYDKSSKSLHFYGLNATVLDRDINPWFIPEKKVPGYEIVTAHPKATFDQVQVVKLHCLQLLSDQADSAGIIKQAQTYGETALKDFFSLLMGKEIVSVHFHPNPYKEQLHYLAMDSVILVEEIATIDSFVARRRQFMVSLEGQAGHKKEEELLKLFLHDLKQMPLILDNGESVPFSYFSKQLPKTMVEDWLVYDSLQAIKWPMFSFKVKAVSENNDITWAFADSTYMYADELFYWFDDTLDFAVEYDALIKRLIRDGQQVIFKRDTDSILAPAAYVVVDILDSIVGNREDTIVYLLGRNQEDGMLGYELVSFADTAKLKGLLYNWNTDSSFIAKATRTEQFDCKSPLARFSLVDLSSLSEKQECDLEDYRTYVKLLNQQYYDIPAVVRWSGTFREKHLNRQVLENRGQNLKDVLEGVRDIFPN